MRRRSSISWLSACFRPLAFGDVARGLGDADDLAGGRADRGDAQRNVDGAAILAHARRLEMFNRLASAGPFDDIAYLVAPVRRDDDVDALADRFRCREAEQAFGGSVPAGNGAVQQFGDDGVVGRFHDRAEEAFAFGAEISLGSGFPAERSEQTSQLGLQADIVDEQDGEHEARGAKAVDAAEIEADVEARDVQDRRQGDVEQPGAHHHHQPDVEDGVRPAEPQHRQCSEAEAPYGRDHPEHDGRVMAAAQQDRQPVVLGGDEPGERGHRDTDRNDARNDRRAGRAPYLRLVVPCLQQAHSRGPAAEIRRARSCRARRWSAFPRRAARRARTGRERSGRGRWPPWP